VLACSACHAFIFIVSGSHAVQSAICDTVQKFFEVVTDAIVDTLSF